MKFDSGKVIGILGILVSLLLISNVFLINNINNMNNKFENYENTISAINDTITKTIENNKIVYSKKTPEINIDDLVNSEFFQTLSADQRKFYTDLKNIKGLISSTSAQLNKQGILINELLASDNGGEIDSNKIIFNLGQNLTFKEEDTTKHLQYEANVKLDSIIRFNMDYDYSVNIQTNYERQKDESILVKYKIDDPELKVTDMYNFTIPAKQPETRLGKWYKKNKKAINIGGGIILFAGGGYVGYQIAK